MPTTRPGFIWSGTEWVAIGQEAVVNPFYYQATAPTGAATGAIWVESDVDVPSIDSSQFLRWRKTMTGGETSLSGNDDSSLPLAYTPGYEQLYINGVLQVRGGDYTATTGTTVTGLTALVANDVVEIFSAVARTVADVYTQTQSDSRFVNKTVGGLNLVIPTGATNGTVGANGAVTIGSAVSSVTVSGAFSATYDAYKIVLSNVTMSSTIATTAILCKMHDGTNSANSNYQQGLVRIDIANGAVAGSNIQNGTAGVVVGRGTGDKFGGTFELVNPFIASHTIFTDLNAVNVSTGYIYKGAGMHQTSTAYSGFQLIVDAGTMTSGTIRIYGYNNGA